jgi:DNA-binding MarR family transcriptional regulator
MVEDIVRRLGYLTLGSRLKRLGERMQAHTQRILDAHGLSIQAAQFPFLAAIDRLGPSTIGQLADAVGGSQPGATRALAQLADAGYVAIETAPDDQRRKYVALTKQGRQLVETGKREVWPAIEAAVKDLCEAAEGALLDQLATLEDGLATVPLDHRAAAGTPASKRRRQRAGSAR